MRTLFLLAGCLFAFSLIRAQTTADFENLGLLPGDYTIDAGSAGYFESGNLSLPNHYNSNWMVWDGWAVSAKADTLTPGYINETSAIAGGGQGGSTAFAVSFVVGASIMKLTGAATGKPVAGMYVTNNTYAYLSMRDGDMFAKKFGGITGNDPDYFLLTVKKYLSGQLGQDSVDFYLADFRFPNNAQDYIVRDWTWLDLSPLGNADSLQFTLSSSDVGAFGMNTPAYFCIDGVVTQDMVSGVSGPLETAALPLYPNPATDFVRISLPDSGAPVQVSVWDATGDLIREDVLQAYERVVRLEVLSPGIYFVRVLQDGQPFVGKVIKR